MRKALSFLLLALLLPFCTLAEPETPVWNYPIGALTLQNNQGYLTLANRESLLDSTYIPDDLVKITAKRVGSFEMREQAHQALLDMFSAAQEAGYTLYVKSAYRSYQTQNTMYYNRYNKNGYDDGWVAYPGSSDHQTGLGVDILNYAWTQKDGMNAEFGKTAEAQWMAAHCHEYGFVIRYLADKEEITGINYEPWHLRYVGTECAAYMKENNLCLEEFTAEYQAYIESFEALGGDFKQYCRQLTTLPVPKGTGEADENGDEETSFFH